MLGYVVVAALLLFVLSQPDATADGATTPAGHAPMHDDLPASSPALFGGLQLGDAAAAPPPAPLGFQTAPTWGLPKLRTRLLAAQAALAPAAPSPAPSTRPYSTRPGSYY